MYNPDEKALTNPKTVAEMTHAYNSALDKVQRGYQLLEDAKNELESAFGREYGSFDTVDRYLSSDNAKGNFENIKAKIKKAAWKKIINLMGIKKLLSISRANEFDKKLDDGKDMPEITDSNIFEMMETLRQQASDYAKEAVMEVFDYLRPGKSEYYKKYKTNDKYAKFSLGKKVILTSCILPGYYKSGFPYRVNDYYGRNNELVATDKVFAMLDGKPVAENYQSPLVDAINTSPDGNGETEYFSFKCYGNGNLHLEFKRLDLVTKMNQLAGNPGELAGEQPKEARKWANPFTLIRTVKEELGIELASILHHQEFWPDGNKTEHSFLSCGFKKGDKKELYFVTGTVNKAGKIEDLFVLDSVITVYTQSNFDVEKKWNEALESFVAG